MNSPEILTCLIFIIIGYFVAMIFTRMCSCNNGFRVGAVAAVKACAYKCHNNIKNNCEGCTEGTGENIVECLWSEDLGLCYNDSVELKI